MEQSNPVSMMRPPITISVILLLLLTHCSGPETHELLLSELPFGEIADPYGPPVRNQSFAQDSININGSVYAHGIGTHAPGRLEIPLQGKATRFEAFIGMDRSIAILCNKAVRDTISNRAGYIYDNRVDHYDYTAGGTAIFRVVVDGKEVFASDTMDIDSDPVAVSIPLKRAKTLELIVDDAGDGSYADYANWAGARLLTSDSAFRPTITNELPKIILNTYGFHPRGLKTGYLHRSAGDPVFRISEVGLGREVFEGTGEPAGDDLGEYFRLDFSGLEQPGEYVLTGAGVSSDTFRIRPGIYAEAVATHLEYITLQRSGHPEKGWTPGEHLDDGVRDDNGKHQDVTGGWYDACDIRKPAAGNAQLLFALVHVMESQPEGTDFDAMLDEARWGNKFLFAMQEPEGYLMEYIGSTWEGYADNRWTDNIIGNEDDRTIITRPARLNTQLLFTIAELKLARMLQDTEPLYAAECMAHAMKCYKWMKDQDQEFTGDRALAAIMELELLSLRGNEEHGRLAARHIAGVLESFEFDESAQTAFFRRSSRHGPLREFGWILYGLGEFEGRFPDHDLVPHIRDAGHRFSEAYVEYFSRQNAFSILPWLVSEDPMDGARTSGKYHYKYFLHVGMNRHLALDAFGLLKFRESEQHLPVVHGHYDWILGANPYNASTVTGIGKNQPDLFKTNAYEFKPPTPELPGGVMTGIGGTPDDRIAMRPGWWWTTEYWSPSVMAMILLTNELNSFYQTD